jgi:TolB-like protein/Tfp pilus assembly protein PilF
MSFLHELKRRHVIRVALAYLAGAWLLIQVLETLFPVFGVSDRLLRLIVVVLAVGFVPALILSWAFEWTPQGIRPDAEIGSDSPERRRSTRALDRVIIVILTIAVLFFATDKFVLDKLNGEQDWTMQAARAKAFSASFDADDMSVAVLPFTSLSDSSEHEHFAHGLTEELLASLATVPKLRVSSRTSVFAISDKGLATREIAEILGVGHILEGSVRRAGDRIRVTTNLIDVDSDTQLWSETFDRQLTVGEILDVQSQIASRVVEALSSELLAETSLPKARGPASLAALDYYHDGLFSMSEFNPLDRNFDENFEKARESFEKAIAIDPEWAPPRAMLGRIYHKARNLADDENEWLHIAEKHIAKALELDPNSGPAHGSMAYLRTVAGDYSGAMQQYDLAISLGENLARWGKALLLRVLGRHDEAIDEYLAAAAVDPLDELGRFQLFETHFCAARFEDSINGLNRFIGVDENNIYARLLLANAHAQAGQTEIALEQAESIIDRIGFEAPLASVFALAGQTERARTALDTLDPNQPFIALDAVPAAVLLGETELALDILERAAEQMQANMDRDEMYSWLLRLQCPPEIRQLQSEPRYQRLLVRLGLPN